MVSDIKGFRMEITNVNYEEISKMMHNELINTAYDLNMINELVFENLNVNELRIAVINKVYKISTDPENKYEDIIDNEKYYTIGTDDEGKPCRIYKYCEKCGYILHFDPPFNFFTEFS